MTDEPKIKEIGGVTYKTQMLPFGIGIKALLRLNKILLPIVAAGIRDKAAMLEALAVSLSEEDVFHFADTFGNYSWYQDGDNWVPLIKRSSQDNQEKHFAGKYLEYMQWLVFCVEVNYSSFFSGSSGAQGSAGLLDLLKQVSPSKA